MFGRLSTALKFKNEKHTFYSIFVIVTTYYIDLVLFSLSNDAEFGKRFQTGVTSLHADVERKISSR